MKIDIDDSKDNNDDAVKIYDQNDDVNIDWTMIILIIMMVTIC